MEQAVLGCLKDALFDLHEGVVWGLLSPAFEEQQRQVGGTGRRANAWAALRVNATGAQSLNFPEPLKTSHRC